jgi:hypothetical protein
VTIEARTQRPADVCRIRAWRTRMQGRSRNRVENRVHSQGKLASKAF